MTQVRPRPGSSTSCGAGRSTGLAALANFPRTPATRGRMLPDGRGSWLVIDSKISLTGRQKSTRHEDCRTFAKLKPVLVCPGAVERAGRDGRAGSPRGGRARLRAVGGPRQGVARGGGVRRRRTAAFVAVARQAGAAGPAVRRGAR